MATEIQRPPYRFVWHQDEHDPCLVRWSSASGRRSWHDWQRFDTPEEARAAMKQAANDGVDPEREASDGT